MRRNLARSWQCKQPPRSFRGSSLGPLLASSTSAACGLQLSVLLYSTISRAQRENGEESGCWSHRWVEASSSTAYVSSVVHEMLRCNCTPALKDSHWPRRSVLRQQDVLHCPYPQMVKTGQEVSCMCTSTGVCQDSGADSGAGSKETAPQAATWLKPLCRPV